MIQKSLDVGILQTWTKSFKASGCVGHDVVKMLNEALHRRGDINVDVVAIMNDTTGDWATSWSNVNEEDAVLLSHVVRGRAGKWIKALRTRSFFF